MSRVPTWQNDGLAVCVWRESSSGTVGQTGKRFKKKTNEKLSDDECNAQTVTHSRCFFAHFQIQRRNMENSRPSPVSFAAALTHISSCSISPAQTDNISEIHTNLQERVLPNQGPGPAVVTFFAASSSSQRGTASSDFVSGHKITNARTTSRMSRRKAQCVQN